MRIANVTAAFGDEGNVQTPRWPRTLLLLAFVLGVGCAAHFLYSWIGLNPTDDGYVLAYSRRILEGQVPHRDFCWIRPPGSALLHAPLVYAGGDRTIWLSRWFVWLQFAVIAWAWTLIVGRALRGAFTFSEQLAAVLLVFILSASIFPVMAWYTVDGMLFVSIGTLLCGHRSSTIKFVGYFLLALAYLCKQNFVVVVPAVLFVSGDWRRVRYWVAGALPGLVYVGTMYLLGGLADAWVQLRSETGILGPGVLMYISTYFFPWGIIFGYSGMYLAFQRDRDFWLPVARVSQAGCLLLHLILLAPAVLFLVGRFQAGSYFLIGAVLGECGYLLLSARQHSSAIRAGILVLIVSWSASISVGYNFPVLAGGAMGAILLGYARLAWQEAGRSLRVPRASTVLIFAAAALTAFSFDYARRTYVYNDRPARQLVCSLDGVLAGARGIKTNANTYAFFVDLQRAVRESESPVYAVLPGASIYWIKSLQTNPLCMEWPHGIEIARDSLFRRVVESVESQRGRIVVLVAKVDAVTLADDSPALRQTQHENRFVDYVRQHFRRTGETAYFELYR